MSNVADSVNIPPSGYEYCINARSRPVFNSNPFAFTISMVSGGQILKEGASYRVVLRNIQFQNNLPNINSYNNSFAFNFNGILYTSVLAVGNYTITTFVNSLNTALAAANANLSVTYDTNGKLLTLNIPANSTFSWYRGSVNQGIPDNRLYKQAPYDRFLAMIGFIDAARANTVITTSAASSLTGTSLVNLYGTSFVDVTISSQLNCIHMQPLARQILVRVPILVDFGQIVRHDPTYAISFTMDYSALGTIEMSCYDEWGNLIVDAPYDTSFQTQLLIIPLNQGNN